MGYNNNHNESDYDKLYNAYIDITSKFGSFNNILDAFGLLHMPTAQRYGIAIGIVVFIATITTVIILLIYGGTFQRIAQQDIGAGAIDPNNMSPADARRHRALLLEQLLITRQRLQSNYNNDNTTNTKTDVNDQLSKLTRMLCNVPPPPIQQLPMIPKEKKDINNKNDINNRTTEDDELYLANYIEAYRKCQDKPGGATLSGRPEARYEAYARSYAGCGIYTNKTYRRSYGRIYESVTCADHHVNDKYDKIYLERPMDLIGKHIRLEPTQSSRHVNELYETLSGEPTLDHKSYDPNEVWGFQPEGPFKDVEEMKSSYIFNHNSNECSFVVIHNITDKVMGFIMMTNDNPNHLTIQLEPPVMSPNKEGTIHQMECCYILIDRIFALGYRRIQISIDTQDYEKRKLCIRLGFTLEGVYYKHCIIKDSSRDSMIYSILNNDWKITDTKNARASLFSKIYGPTAYQADIANIRYELECDEKQSSLVEQKKEQEQLNNEEAKQNKNNGSDNKKIQ